MLLESQTRVNGYVVKYLTQIKFVSEKLTYLPLWQGNKKRINIPTYPICEFLAPVSSSAQRKSLFPLNKEMSSEWEDPKEGKVFLASDLWSHSQCGLSGLFYNLPLSQ